MRRRVVRCVLLLAAWTAAACGGEATGGDGEVGDAAGAGGAAADARETAPAPDTALRRLAREAVPRVEAAAGLEFRRPPRLARSSRERLAGFIRRQLEEQLPPERARGIERSYRRLGLLPDTVALRALMEELYLAQVVGYYAPGADTLFVRRGVSGATLEPVLVHEMVHALQDQHMDLDSLMEARRGSNDAAAAAQAALEGHATYVMLEDALRRRTGRDVDLGSLPDLAKLFRGVDLSSLGGAPELAGAPRVVRESLLFPYLGGLGFLQEYWRAQEGRPAPLGERMPSSTEQILHPRRFMGDRIDVPTRVRFAGRPAAGWDRVHADNLGEFEVRLLLEEFLADSARILTAAAGWDGDRYRLLSTPEGGEVMVWATVWDAPADAVEFADAVREALARRYGRAPGSGQAPGSDSADAPDVDEPRGDGTSAFTAAARTVRVRRLRREGREVVLVDDVPASRDVGLPGWATRLELREVAP